MRLNHQPRTVEDIGVAIKNLHKEQKRLRITYNGRTVEAAARHLQASTVAQVRYYPAKSGDPSSMLVPINELHFEVIK